MNLGEIYNKLQSHINRQDITYQTDNSSETNTKDLIYFHVANLLNNNIGNNLFKPLYWRKHLTQCKIAGVDLPQFLGGLKLTYTDVVEIFAIFGIIDLNLRDAPGIGHARILTHHSEKFSTVLNGVLNAEEYVAIAITEEGTGSDLHALETVAIPVRNGYILNGKKSFIARIEEASYFIVFAYVLRRNNDKKLTAFLVSKTQTKLACEPIDCTGFKGVSWGKIIFSNAFISTNTRIGEEGQGFKIFTEHFTYWRTVQSAAALGSAYAGFAKALDYVQSRKCFGRPIGEFSHIQQEIAYHFSRLTMCWLLVEKIMDTFDNNCQYYEACMLKAESLEIAINVLTWSMKVHGARGCVESVLLEKRLSDLLALRIADGVTDVLRNQVAKSILGKALYELSLEKD